MKHKLETLVFIILERKCQLNQNRWGIGNRGMLIQATK